MLWVSPVTGASSLSQDVPRCAATTKQECHFSLTLNATAQFRARQWWKGCGDWFSHPTEQMSGFVCTLDNGRHTWLLQKEIILCFKLQGFQNCDRQQTHETAWDRPSFSNYSLLVLLVFKKFLKENYYFIVSEWLQAWGLRGKYQISPTCQQWDPDPFHCTNSLGAGTGVTITLICETMRLFGFTRVTKSPFTFPWFFISLLNLQLPAANLEIVACWDICQKYHPS